MALARPKFVVLDSATLGRLSWDYWSQDATARDKARTFLSRLSERGVHVALTTTHICELLAHNDARISQNRLAFLRNISLIAWLRPYNRVWFPGNIMDLLTRELHAVIHLGARNWKEIIQSVRPELWETGTGSDMFADNAQLWLIMRSESQRQINHAIYIASVARTDPTGISGLKFRDALKLPRRSKEERANYLGSLADNMKAQLVRHGDKRLKDRRKVAGNFAQNTFAEVEAIEAKGESLLNIAQSQGVPPELINPGMTIGQIGELAVYGKKLALFVEKLNPRAQVDVKRVPPATLPSYVLEGRLASIQQRADRISGSDLGDGHIVPLTLYADGVEVDKRTWQFLQQIQRADPKLSQLMGPFFRSSDYVEIPNRFD